MNSGFNIESGKLYRSSSPLPVVMWDEPWFEPNGESKSFGFLKPNDPWLALTGVTCGLWVHVLSKDKLGFINLLVFEPKDIHSL